jgi:hypothetical protein
MNLGQLIEADIKTMQNRPAREVAPPAKPEVPDGMVIDRLIEAALPQSRSYAVERSRRLAKEAKQKQEDERRALANSFNGEFEYEQAVPSF